MGFEPDVQTIHRPHAHQPKPDAEEAEDERSSWPTSKVQEQVRQTVMFLWPPCRGGKRLARTYLRRPAVALWLHRPACGALEQVVYLPFMKENEKRNKLINILNQGIEPPIIIFVNQKKAPTWGQGAGEDGLQRWPPLHGGKGTRAARAWPLRPQDGHQGRNILEANTDVAGRGIDIKDVSMVINYDMAKSIEMYTPQDRSYGSLPARGQGHHLTSPRRARSCYTYGPCCRPVRCALPA